jgi:hypothetical protein
MPDWLIGRLAAPFILLLVFALVVRPASRWVHVHMPESALKRVLFIHSERDPRAYKVGAWLIIIGFYVVLFAMCAHFTG